MFKNIQADISDAGSGGLSLAAAVPLPAIGGSPSTVSWPIAGAVGVDAGGAWADAGRILWQPDGDSL